MGTVHRIRASRRAQFGGDQVGGSGGNFDEELFMDEAGNLTPRGPLSNSNNTMEEIYSWVVQTRDDGTAAAHISETDNPQDFIEAGSQSSWTVARSSTPPSQHGTFKPGPAVGLALGIAKTPDDKIHISWWSDSLTIVTEPPATGTTSGA
jgi:hypothetical protein